MTTSTDTTTALAGPALMAEGLRRIAEADEAFTAAQRGWASDGSATIRSRFDGTECQGNELAPYVQHLIGTGHALILAAQTAAMVASGIHLDDNAQQAWRDACAGVDQLNRPAAARRY